MGNNINELVSLIIEEITKRKKDKSPLVIGIDGYLTAGKTTIANTLQDVLKCNVIHLDNFFIPLEQRSLDHQLKPDGNVDYKRFITEVMKYVEVNKDFSYRPFDCTKQEYESEIFVKANPITIIEGTNSLHPQLMAYYDLKVFLTVNSTCQLERLKARNPLQLVEFEEKWLVMEDNYFNYYQIKENSDLVYDTSRIK